MTLEQAKTLKYGQTIYCDTYRNFDGSPQRWRVNGAVKLWKRDSERIEVPLKHGLYDFGKLNAQNCGGFCLTEEEV